MSRPPYDMPGDAILIELQTQQHLNPHRPLAEMLESARDEVGFCRNAAGRAIRSVGLDGTTKIGRLDEMDLVALTRAIRGLCRGSGDVMAPASVA
ncbi:MAG: hypothetical protein ABSH20_26905 [Tepidisphaeraceae bacterium]